MNNFYKEKKDIISWLDNYQVKNYTLIPNDKYGFVVDVSSGVELRDNNLDFIPVKFNSVDGSLYCFQNKLISLEFCPKYVGGSFSCRSNKLTSLEFCPSCVGNSFDCGANELKNLEFSPESVGKNFYCDLNPKLGKLQEVNDFKEIYLEHKNFLIDKFSNKLNDYLVCVEENRKTTKIKL